MRDSETKELDAADKFLCSCGQVSDVQTLWANHHPSIAEPMVGDDFFGQNWQEADNQAIFLHPGGFRIISSTLLRIAVASLIGLLYSHSQPSEIPLSDVLPISFDRNRQLFERYKAGARAADLAKEFGISERRVRYLIKRFKTKGH